MTRIVSPSEWDRIEEALMRAEIPYRISFDSHIVNDEEIVYDRIIDIDIFKFQTRCFKNKE